MINGLSETRTRSFTEDVIVSLLLLWPFWWSCHFADASGLKGTLSACMCVCVRACVNPVPQQGVSRACPNGITGVVLLELELSLRS